MNDREPIIFEDDDYCSVCNTQHSVELYNIYNKEVNYTLLLQMRDKIDNIVDKSILSQFKCRRCGAKFNIDWTIKNGVRFPTPFKQKYLLNKFKEKR